MTTSVEVGLPALAGPGPLLRAVRVEDLFGRYTYEVAVPPRGDNRLLLIHGDNGSGKTTLLRLVWHLLGPSERRGHRTFLSQTPFRRLQIELDSGHTVTATKRDGVLGAYEIVVDTPNGPDQRSVYEVDERLVVRPASFDVAQWSEQAALWELDSAQTVNRNLRIHFGGSKEYEDAQAGYLAFLHGQGVNPLLLADDRSLYSDDPELERLRERHERTEVGPSSPRRTALTSGDLVARELRLTLRRVTDWFRTLMLGGQNTGSAGANSIYKNVLQELASPAGNQGNVAAPASAQKDVRSLLVDLQQKSPRFEEYGLVPHFDADEFIRLFAAVESHREALAVQILTPFLDSLEARYAALEEPAQKLRSLISLVNDFMVDKSVTFSLDPPSE